ncbi:MAG TPA: serine/threonine-protein kinase, partial [Edaphobacter sp.]|nr:serine/threonine-protein kinase [Edaphobacter sp.]
MSRLERNVALKISHIQFSPSFEREAKAISALNHPHICTLYDVGKLPSGEGYLVMELVEGEFLRDRLRAGPLEKNDVLRIGAETADALAEAHKQGILHCDLKPANITLSRHGVKVVDFGLARMTAHPEDAVAVMGTPAYMAPERMNGKEAAP